MDNWKLIDDYCSLMEHKNKDIHGKYLDTFMYELLKKVLKITLDNPVISRENIIKILEEEQWQS